MIYILINFNNNLNKLGYLKNTITIKIDQNVISNLNIDISYVTVENKDQNRY